MGIMMSDSDDMERNRNYPREVISIKTEIMIDGIWHDCELDDISPAGAMLRIERAISLGMVVILKFGEFGPFNATVVRCDGYEVGVKFNHDPLEMTPVLIKLALNG